MQRGRTGQEQHPTKESIGQVAVAGAERLRGAAVDDERVRREGEHLVENKKGEQVAGERYAHGRGDADREEAKEAASVRRALEVADGVDGRHEPEDGRERNKEQTE